MLNRISCAVACLVFLGNLAGFLTQAQQARDRGTTPLLSVFSIFESLSKPVLRVILLMKGSSIQEC